MSGGHFEYMQYRINDIVESIQEEIDRSGRALSKEELDEEKFWSWGRTHHYEYPEDIISEFKKGIELLKMAQVYAQRIDWLISGDDGEDSFRERLKEELKELKQQDK